MELQTYLSHDVYMFVNSHLTLIPSDGQSAVSLVKTVQLFKLTTQ